MATDAASSVAVADLNGDGRPYIVATQFLNNELSVALSGEVESVTLSAPAPAPALPGSVSVSVSDEVVAAYTGDADFAASVSNTLTLPSHPLATKTTLAATPTSAALGAVVTLTATVTDSNSKPVTAGSVSFYNGTTLLQTLPLAVATNGTVAAGTATLKLADLPAGSDSLTAQFIGTVYDTASTSAAKTVTITGKYLTTTALTVAGTSVNYTLTGMVTSGAIANPTGSVVFTDTTASPNVVIGTVSLAGAASTSTFLPPSTPSLGTDNNPTWVVTGDFNGDGKQDIAVANGAGTVGVYLGNGDGTFAAPQATGGLNNPQCLVAGDFNGDGKPDIAASISGIVGIFFDVGDGTFGAEADFAAGQGVVGSGSVTAGDVNLDGKLDLVVANSCGAVDVMLGNGDGTFQAGQNYTAGGNPSQAVIADVNGDGNPDLVVSGGIYVNSVGVLLGGGEGRNLPGSADLIFAPPAPSTIPPRLRSRISTTTAARTSWRLTTTTPG